MAYGVTDPANDWVLVQTGNSNYAAAHYLHLPILPTGLPQNHGESCLTLYYRDGSETLRTWRYTNTNFVPTNNQSIRIGLILTEDSSEFGGPPYVGVNPSPLVYTKLNTTSHLPYFFGLFRRPTEPLDRLYLGSYYYTWEYASMLSHAVAYSAPFVINKEDYYAIRLDCTRVGDDQRLEGYYVYGLTNVDNVDEQMQPTWIKTIDVWHRSGTQTPDIIQGTATGTSWNPTVSEMYSGYCGWAPSKPWGDDCLTHIDTIRVVQS